MATKTSPATSPAAGKKMGAGEFMTPQFSRQLALCVNSPYWQEGDRYKAKQAFIEQVTQYATLDDLPPRLKAIYTRAMRGMSPA